VLEASSYPDGFPQKFKLAYVPESRQAVVEYELPAVEVVPAVKAYRYVKSSDTIADSARPQSQIKALYASVVAQVAIRTPHELFLTDKGGHIDTVVFNGIVDTTDPGSGLRIRPCLVTVRTTRESFSGLDLSHVEPLACLKHLSAGVSKSPSELLPVRPVLEFSMVDPRFVAESDALSQLDQRPNLMDLSFVEFEALIQNLFTKMGLEARQTRPSRDGGVDCVAWDPRPIFGGKVVIQAKRYKNTVGVSAVRDLFGTLQNEGASKGILVTTSGYGQASFDFARNKPIELIDGSNLLYLLAEHAGIEAKIVPSDDWKDPVADTPEPHP
jgi:restriction system protein